MISMKDKFDVAGIVDKPQEQFATSTRPEKLWRGQFIDDDETREDNPSLSSSLRQLLGLLSSSSSEIPDEAKWSKAWTVTSPPPDIMWPITTEPSIKDSLKEAYDLRATAAAVSDNEWRGLEAMCYIRSLGSAVASDLATRTSVELDELVPVLMELAIAGLVKTEGKLIECTGKGVSLIEAFERNSGINLDPEQPSQQVT